MPMATLNVKAFLLMSSLITLVYMFTTLSTFHQTSLSVDYTSLIDIPFEFRHLPHCSQNQTFVILVHTSIGNKERRDVLRETWAAKNKTNADIFFLIGESDKAEENKDVLEEIKQHGNFVQGDFLDSYSNLTYKHVMGLKYIFYHCPNIEYIIKIDDDTFVNIPVLKSFLDMYTKQNGHTNDMFCSKRVNHGVLREGKWAVSTEEYPDSIYPPHCLGYAIIYPKKAIELLYPVAQRTKYFWIDDVHVTGVVASGAGVGQIDIDSLLMSDYELATVLSPKYDLDMRPVLFGPSQTSAAEIRRLNEYLWKFGNKSSIMDYLNK